MWLFHRHKWNEVNRQFGVVAKYANVLLGGGLLGNGTGTLITLYCECGKHKQVDLDGIVEKN